LKDEKEKEFRKAIKMIIEGMKFISEEEFKKVIKEWRRKRILKI